MTAASPALMGPFAEVVIGATDVGATVAFLRLFGFEPIGDVTIDAPEASAVFGRDDAVVATRLASSARRDAATLLVVPTPLAGEAPTAWQRGPRALDVYTVDLDATLAIAVEAGFAASPVGGLSAGPMTMRQAMVHGPGALSVVFVESTHRRSSVLDGDVGLVHSEPHSVVWVVGDHAAEVAWWTTGGWTTEGRWDEGFVAGTTISFSEPSISDELGLPDRPTPITMTMISDVPVSPIRLELMTFDNHPARDPARGPDPGAGLVADPAAGRGLEGDASSVLRSGVFALAVDGGGGDGARLVRSPGGVRVVLRP